MKVSTIQILLAALLPGPVAAQETATEPRIHGSIACDRLDTAACAERAKITAARAAMVAKARHPGKVLSVAEEIEDGFLVFAVSIGTGKPGYLEVLVDAGDARILSSEVEPQPGSPPGK